MFLFLIYRQLCDKVEDEIRDGKAEVNVMGWFSRAALEYIGQGGLGYSFESLDLNKKNVYGDAVKMFVYVSLPILSTFIHGTRIFIRHSIYLSSSPVLIDLDKHLRVLPYVMNIGPAWFRRFIIDILPSKPVQKMKGIIDIMQKTSEDIVAQKREALAAGEDSVVRQMGAGKDIMSILCEFLGCQICLNLFRIRYLLSVRANMAADEKDRLTEVELIGQMRWAIS